MIDTHRPLCRPKKSPPVYNKPAQRPTCRLSTSTDTLGTATRSNQAGLPATINLLSWGLAMSTAGAVGFYAGLDSARPTHPMTPVVGMVGAPLLGVVGQAGGQALQACVSQLAPEFTPSWPFTLAGCIISASVGARLARSMQKR